MNIGVEVLKESVIRVQSQLNDWMDCVFVVSKDDEEKAREVLEKAWDSFWEDGDGWCYGNYLEDKVYMDAPKTIQYGILAICNEVRGISKAETAKELGITTSYITVSMRRAADKLKLPVMFAWYGYHNLK